MTVSGHGAASPIDLEFPFTGRWRVLNSPANRVPSHGTALFASSYAIDFLPVDKDGRTAPVTVGTLMSPESPKLFAGFGRAIVAPVAGTVVAARDIEPDHPAYRGLSSVRYAFTQRSRAQAGWEALAGNYVFIESGRIVIALSHLKYRSVRVRLGERVRVGEMLGRCGNSGNSTEPHLHVQAIDNRDVERANAVRATFRGLLPRNGDMIDAAR